MLFHAGAIWRLNELGLLRKIPDSPRKPEVSVMSGWVTPLDSEEPRGP
jgi:hypothetical protein